MAKNRIRFSNDFILKNEQVGINTTEPRADLDVNGTLKVSGISTFISEANFDDNVNIDGTLGIGTIIDIVSYDTLSNGTLSFEGSAGQLFSITNNLTSGSIFSVNDVSGIPSIDVDADGTIQLAPFGSAEYVGVGKTNPTEKLDVIGNVKVSGLTTTQNLYVTGVSTFINDPVLIGSGTSTGTTTQRLQVTGGAYISGNTGIGTTNPTEKVDVIGNVQVGQASTTSTAWSILRIKKAEGSGAVDFTDEGAGITTNTNPQYLVGRKFNERRDSLAIWRFVGNGNGGVGGHLTADALFQPSGDVYVNNNLGIGTTNPTEKLDVIGNVKVSGLTTTQNLYVTGVSTFINDPVLIGSGTSTGTTTQRLQVTGGAYISGNTGIGTTNPQANLDIWGGSANTTYFRGGTGNVARQLQIRSEGTITPGAAHIFNAPSVSGTIIFETNNDEALRIDSSQRIGIGSISPTQLLDVNGNARLRGALYDANNSRGNLNEVLVSVGAGLGVTWKSLSSGEINVSVGVNSATTSTPYYIIGVEDATGVTTSFYTDTDVVLTGDGRLGIGTTNPTYKLQVVGDFAATTKSFSIPHPTKQGMTLRYGSLESPYHGIRLTGSSVVENGKCIVELPDYIHKLVKEEDINIHITNIRHGKVLWVESVDISHNNFMVMTESTDGSYEFYWDFTAIRNDIDEMIVEF